MLSLFERAHQGEFFPLTDSIDPVVLAAAVQQCVGFELLDIRVACTYSTDHFEMAYTVVGPTAVPADDENGNEVPDYMENVATNLESSWTLYLGLGYQPPDEIPILVTIGLTPPGSGVVGPNQIIHLSNVNGDQYLPRHELFHVFQWEYGGDSVLDRGLWFGRTGTDWWMEATAEWAAHQASPDGVQEADRYASELPDFLGFPDRALHAHAWIDGPSGRPQYGAFVFAEYLEERLGTDVILATFERTAQADQLGALAAVEAVVAERGSTLGGVLVDFARQAYLMDFQDGDVGVWRGFLANDQRDRTVADDLGDARPFRGRHTLALGDSESGEVVVEPGGRFYVDLVAVGDDVGTLRVEVDVLSADLVAELLSFSTYPIQCRPPILFPGDADAALLRIPIDGDCRHATLSLAHLDPVRRANRRVSWQVTFAGVETVLADRRSAEVSDSVSVSDDGRFVSAVVYGEPDPEVRDLLVVDTETGGEVRVSGANFAGDGQWEIEYPKVTLDGSRFTAAISDVFNVGGGTGFTSRVAWWDRSGGVFEGPFIAPAPTPAQPAGAPSISDDGARIGYWSRDSSAKGMLVVYDVGTDTTSLVHLSTVGLPATGDISPGYLSGDGNTFTFAARSELSGPWQIYAAHLVTGTFTVLSVDEAGAPGGQSSFLAEQAASVSDDGGLVSLLTASSLVAADTDTATDLYVADRDPDGNGILDDTAVEVSLIPTSGDVFAYEMSGNGRFVAYNTSQGEVRLADLTSGQDMIVAADPDRQHQPAVDNLGWVYYSLCDFTQPYPWPCTVYRS